LNSFRQHWCHTLNENRLDPTAVVVHHQLGSIEIALAVVTDEYKAVFGIQGHILLKVLELLTKTTEPNHGMARHGTARHGTTSTSATKVIN
jgi:hypothetical protein